MNGRRKKGEYEVVVILVNLELFPSYEVVPAGIPCAIACAGI